MSVSVVNNVKVGDWIQFPTKIPKKQFKILSITSIGYRLLGSDGEVYKYNTALKVLVTSNSKFFPEKPTVLTDTKKYEAILKTWRQANGSLASQIDIDTCTFCEKTNYFSLIKNEIVDPNEKKTARYEYFVYEKTNPSPVSSSSPSASPIPPELEERSLFRSIAMASPTSEMRESPVSELSSPRTETSMSVSPSPTNGIEERYDEALGTTVYTV